MEGHSGHTHRMEQYSNILNTFRNTNTATAGNSNRFHSQAHNPHAYSIGSGAQRYNEPNRFSTNSTMTDGTNAQGIFNAMTESSNPSSRQNLSVTFSSNNADHTTKQTSFARGRGIRRVEQTFPNNLRLPPPNSSFRDGQFNDAVNENPLLTPLDTAASNEVDGEDELHKTFWPRQVPNNNSEQNNGHSGINSNSQSIINASNANNNANNTHQLSSQAHSLIDNRLHTIDLQDDPIRHLQEQGLWRNPHNLDDSMMNTMFDPSTPGSRGRSRERRTPPFGSRCRDTYPRGRNYSGESLNHSPQNKHKSRLGINDTAESFAKEKLIWPQKQLGFRFLQNQPSFDQLQFEHLVLGELCTIAGCESSFEASNRLRLLQRIAYWKMKGAAWYQIRNFYAAFLSGVEAHDLDWNDAFTDLENMIIDRPSTRDIVRFDKKPKFVKKDDNPWFCKKFNSEIGSTLESGHIITTQRGDQKPALHICARCLRLKKGRKEHSEVSKDCPERQ